MSKTIQFHIGMIIAAAFFLLISYLPYKSSVRAIDEKKIFAVSISKKSCYGGKPSNHIYFIKNDKEYKVKVVRSLCFNLNIGDKINVLYDHKDDKYWEPAQATFNVKRLKFFIIFFLLTLIPYPLVYRKFFKK